MYHAPEVFDLLAPIDRASTFLSAVEAFMKAASDPQTGPDVRQAYKDAKARLRDPANPVISIKQATEYNYIKRGDRADVKIEEYPQFVDHLVTAIYAKSVSTLERNGLHAFVDDVPAALRTLKIRSASLRGDLFGDVIVESERRAAKDAAYSAKLAQFRTELDGLATNNPGLQSQWEVALDDNSDSDCSCIAEGCNSQGHCRQFCLGFWDCLLLFFGIILLIVLG